MDEHVALGQPDEDLVAWDDAEEAHSISDSQLARHCLQPRFFRAAADEPVFGRREIFRQAGKRG